MEIEAGLAGKALRIGISEAGGAGWMALSGGDDEFLDGPGLDVWVCFVGEGWEVEEKEGGIVVYDFLFDSYAIGGVVELVTDVLGVGAGKGVVVVHWLFIVLEVHSQGICWVPSSEKGQIEPDD